MKLEIIREEENPNVTIYIIDGFQVSKEVYEIIINHIAQKENKDEYENQ